MHPRMIYKTFNPELLRRTKSSTDLLVSICKQAAEQNVPYATFFRSAMAAVNGACTRLLSSEPCNLLCSQQMRAFHVNLQLLSQSRTVNGMRQLHIGYRNLQLNLKLSPIVGGRWPRGGNAMLVKSLSSHQEFLQQSARVPLSSGTFETGNKAW